MTAKSKGEEADDALWLIRHDAAHVMATAVVELWPGTKVSIGPPIEGGFYYDFEFPDGERPSEADLERIEAAMREHIAADEPFERTELPAAEAIERFRAEDQPYKVELIEDLVRDEGVETVSLYRNGPFTDLCRGPHAPSTGRIKAFKLNSIAGAYWRGDENRQMLTRIYGTAFHSQKELDEQLERLELARENDHRRLGPELNLFRFREEAPGMPFWLPNGTVLLRLIEREVREQLRQARLRRDQDPAGARRGALAPLRPLGQLPREHVLRRAGRARGRRAPLRAQADELPGGLPRVRLRAPLLPRAAAAAGRVRRRLALRARGRPARAAARSRLHPGRRATSTARSTRSRTRSTRSARRSTSSTRASASTTCGSSSRPGRKSRSAATSSGSAPRRGCARRSSARAASIEISPGEGTFYGPKIDFHVTDALGRSWQLGTCQLDFQMPERFELTYQGEDNAEHRPVMIHRALLGSMERFAGILIEHYGGRFPAWLAPVQVVGAAGLRPAPRLRAPGRRPSSPRRGVRVSVDERSESVGRKIRDAELAKVPLMVVVGEREEADGHGLGALPRPRRPRARWRRPRSRR